MTEAYNISSRLTFTSNAATVIADLFVQFEKLDKAIAGAQGGLGKLSKELRALGGSSRGINSTIAALEKLGQVKTAPSVIENIGRVTSAARQLAEVQASIAKSAAEGAAAWRSMAQSAPRAMSRVPANGGLPPVGGGGQGGPVGGGGGRRGGRGGGNAGPFGQDDDYQNAHAENRNLDQVRRNQRAQADHENENFDRAARVAAEAAAERKRAADLAAGKKYDADHYQAMQENAVRDARERRARMSHTDWTNAAMGAQMGGQAGMGLFGGALKAEMEVREHLAMLGSNTTMDEKALAEARAKADEITKLVPGTTTAGNLHNIVDLYTAMGEAHEALEGAPVYSRAAYLMANMPGQHRGDTSFAAAQATEVMQRHIGPDGKPNVDAFNHAMNAMVQVAYGTGGRVDGSTYLGFAKQSRAGGMVADDQYLYRDLPAMLIALGGNRAGTGDAALWNQFVTGKMTANAFGELQRAGIIDKKAEWKHGQVLDMERHLRGADGFAHNRVQWMRDEFFGPGGVFERNHIDPHDKKATERFLSKWASRQTGLGFMSEGVLGMGNIDKEAGKINTTRDAAGLQAYMREHDPMQAVREFKAAENELMLALGKEALGPALEVLKSLTQAVRDLAAWGKEHPDAAKNLTLIGGGLSVLATGAGEVAMVIFVGAPLLNGLAALARALGPFGPGGAAEAGLAGASSGLNALAGNIAAFVTRLTALGLTLSLKGDTPGGGTPATPEQIEAAKKSAEEINKRTGNTGSFWNDLGKWWRGDTGGKPTNPIAPADNPMLRQHSSLTRPPSDPNVTFLATITLDGQAIAKNIEGRLVRSGSGPSGGSTGFDARTVYAGGMHALA